MEGWLGVSVTVSGGQCHHEECVEYQHKGKREIYFETGRFLHLHFVVK